jgi:hypothetical protein
MMELRDGGGTVLALVDALPPVVESDDPEIAAWATEGCPCLRGVQEGDTIREVPGVVAPDDPLWGLAVIREAERRGWTLG